MYIIMCINIYIPLAGSDIVSKMARSKPRKRTLWLPLEVRGSIEIRTGFPPVFFCVKNMSRCVKYQEPGEDVGIGFCHSCHSVKNPRHKQHLGWEGTHPTMSQQTRVLSRTTHTNGDPLSSHDFSNLTNSPSPTPELQYTRDGTTEYVHSKCTC